MVLSKSKSLDDMVLPGKERSWEHIKKKWFVLEPSQLRTPGDLVYFENSGRFENIFKDY